MATDMTTIAGAVKRVYDDYVEKQQNLKRMAIDEIANSLTKYNPGGEGFFGAINDYGNESVGAINENESFRTIDNEHYAQWKVTPKVQVGPIEFSGLASKAADTDEEAFVSVVVDALDMARERLLKDENRQFFGLGTGLMAHAAGAVSSLATSFSVDNAQYLRANMVIDVCSAGSSTLIVSAVRITDVDKASNVVYLGSAIGISLATSQDIIKQNIRVSQPSDGKETMGLRGIVDDGTDLSTFQNIDVTANRIWRGRRIDASAGNLTSDLLQRLLDDVRTLCGEEPDLLLMHPKQRRKYLDIVVPQKRYMDGDMDSGFKKLEFNGHELLLDVDCQSDTVYALKKNKIRKFEVEAMGMGTQDGSDRFLRKVNQDVFQAYWRHYVNFGTSQRNAHGKITNLATPTGIS